MGLHFAVPNNGPPLYHYKPLTLTLTLDWVRVRVRVRLELLVCVIKQIDSCFIGDDNNDVRSDERDRLMYIKER